MKRTLPLLIFVLLIAIAAKAQYRHQEVGLQTDNDSYLAQGSDRYYTNGIFIYYRRALPFDEDGKIANRVLGFEAGQKMFNPQSGSINVNGVADPGYIDRPFAGYLYLGANYNVLYKKQSNFKVGLQLGVVGPRAYGRQAQNLIHKVFGFYPPDGWQYQIKNALVINASGEYNKMLARGGNWVDVSFTSYANLGTGFIGGGLGPMLRLGRFNKLFNSVITQSTVIDRPGVKANDQEFFFYYKPLVNLQVKDITVEGKGAVYPESMQVAGKLNKVMISNQLGGAFNSGDRWTVDASVIFHTKDVKEMVRSHQWGSVTVMYHFD
ncbi:lipid A deacylase LpxR family protein [Mucilaginibacter sp. RS28]|uniref:Lipid A deacylase LpxR family protein n=1 Tax=Mucilaginibacter straminoryzae TaxID=2932774 RepID=A0A9X1X352_9SPHI|nr:lipid A deacylase LpxR family protein [Mucilaginibacter straminoryzae]MCJ8210128.1 lipid A deacylase LpxR family protein [Mucilaginibacter straminoryzae]